MTKSMKIQIVGSGCSSGVPRADGYWGACDPHNPKNRRRRCSAFVSKHDKTIVIDTSPDFREQAIDAKLSQIDAVLFTHDHADQTHGLDDLRAFVLSRRKKVDAYMDQACFDSLVTKFHYIFHGQNDYPAICQAHFLPPLGTDFSLHGFDIKTFDQVHGHIHSVGYRIDGFAYSSDISDLPEDSFATLQNLDLWVVDALRYAPHPSHSHLEKTLAWIERVRPKRAILTNLHQDMDYEVLKSQLPDGVEPAFDGMEIII